LRKLLRFFFYHLYHTFAWTYDFVAAIVSVGRWKDWGSASLPYIHGPRVLEIGFGTGHLQVELNRRGYQPLGLDESQQMAEITRKNLTKNRLTPMLSRGVAQSLPFAAHSLDSVVATFPSEYIMDKGTLAELYRVLKFSGRLVMVPMAQIGGRKLPDRAAKWLFQVTGQAVEITASLENRLRLIFSQAGFKVEIISLNLRNSLVLVVIAEKTGEPQGISTNLRIC
jgi:ubiquinone/menaquinone biosynthesis C-methylase UbiE